MANKWWQKITTLGGDAAAALTGGVLGAKWAEGNIKTEVLKQAGNELRQHFSPNRKEVMEELLLLGDDGLAIVSLLKEANKKHFIKCGGKRYLENWIVSMLLKVDPKHRSWVYVLLNEICETDRCEFFTFLEILSNDGFVQYLYLAKEMFKDLSKSESVKRLRLMLKDVNKKMERIAKKIEKKNAEFEKRRKRPLATVPAFGFQIRGRQINFRGFKIPRFNLYR